MNYRHVLKMIDEIRMLNGLPSRPLYRNGENLFTLTSKRNSRLENHFLPSFESAPVFVIDNVYRYYASLTPSNGHDGKYVGDVFPYFRLPYPQTWFEYTRPRDDRHTARVGVLCREISKNGKALGVCGTEGHLITFDVFAKLHDLGLVGPMFSAVLEVSEDNRIAAANKYTYEEGENTFQTGPRPTSPQELRNADQAITPIFYAIQFLNCKNVVTETKEPPQTINERHRRSHPPLVTYRVLRIDRGKHYAGVSNTTGAEDVTRYHICRGHFKHYSEDKPLFGKFVGTYWWEAHARGNKELGEVIKDYELTETQPC